MKIVIYIAFGALPVFSFSAVGASAPEDYAAYCAKISPKEVKRFYDDNLIYTDESDDSRSWSGALKFYFCDSKPSAHAHDFFPLHLEMNFCRKLFVWCGLPCGGVEMLKYDYPLDCPLAYSFLGLVEIVRERV